MLLAAAARIIVCNDSATLYPHTLLLQGSALVNLCISITKFFLAESSLSEQMTNKQHFIKVTIQVYT